MFCTTRPGSIPGLKCVQIGTVEMYKDVGMILLHLRYGCLIIYYFMKYTGFERDFFQLQNVRVMLPDDAW